MPAYDERQALERERRDLPGQLALYEGELDATAPQHKAGRERLAWQIRRIQKRLVEIERRLVGS